MTQYSAHIEQVRFGWRGWVARYHRNIFDRLDTSRNRWRPSRRWVEHACRKAMARYERRDARWNARREAAYTINADGSRDDA